MADVASSPVSPTDTVTAVSALTVPLALVAVTVTVVAPALSATLDGLADRVISSSSSSMVTLVPVTVRSVAVPLTLMLSSLSSVVSSTGVRVKVPVPLLLPESMVRVKSGTAL